MEDIDREEWNDLLSRSDVCDAFQAYDWAKVLRDSFGSRPRFLIVQRKGEAIGGVMFFEKKMLGVLSSYEVRGGPLYVGQSRDLVMEILLKVFKRKKRQSAYLLFVPSPLINYRFRRLFETSGYYSIPFRTILVDLTRPLEQVWASLKKQARWGVRKAERMGVEVSVADRWEEWMEYYNLHVSHSRAKHYSTDPYSFFKEMFRLRSDRTSQLFVAKHGKQIIAGSLFLVYKKNMVFLQNASSEAFQSYNPNNLIQWRSMEWGKENGVSTYDLNGLPWEKTPYLRGIYKYKKRWDGSIKPQYYYMNNKVLRSGVHLVRTSSLAWRLFSSFRNLSLI